MPTATVTSGFGWSDELLALMQGESLPACWMLEAHGSEESSAWTAGKSWVCSSHSGIAGEAVLDPASVSVEMDQVNLRSWRATVGGWTCELVDVRSFASAKVRRGNWMTLSLGFGPATRDEMAPVARGVLHSCEQIGPTRWRLTIMGPLAGLVSRTRRDRTCEMLVDMPSTTLAADYTAGDATMELTDASEFSSATSHDGGVFLPDGAWLRYSAKVGDDLTIAADGFLGGGDASGTYAAGTVVTQLAVFDGHPVSVMLRVLTSTGSADNGVNDVYPGPMGLGLPQGWVWKDDANQWRALRQPVGTTWRMQHAQAERAGSGLLFLQDLFSRLGFWFVQRQGALTVRAALAPAGPDALRYTITDDDIAVVEGFAWWHPDCVVEYAVHRVIANSYDPEVDPDVGLYDLAAEQVDTRPGLIRAETDISELQWASANEEVHADELNVTVGPWFQQVPRLLTVLLRGWAWGQLCPGDWARLTTRWAGDPLDGGQTYSKRPVMVQGVQRFVGPYTRLMLAIPATPPSSAD
jgi:hypothetical protein